LAGVYITLLIPCNVAISFKIFIIYDYIAVGSAVAVGRISFALLA